MSDAETSTGAILEPDTGAVFARPEVVAGLAAEYEGFAGLVADLDDAEWDTPTRCAGWRVRDVVAHVTGSATDCLDGTIGTRSPDEQAAALRSGTPAQVADTLSGAGARFTGLLGALDDAAWASPSPVPGMTLGRGVLGLWYDAYVHGDDIRAALGRPSARGQGLAASLRWLCDELTRLGWGPAAVGDDDGRTYRIGTGAVGPAIHGHPLRFVLAATGRSDPADLGLDAGVNVFTTR